VVTSEGLAQWIRTVGGGDRSKTNGFTVKVQPAAVTVCVPYPERP
jgi:hypothetical protein